MTTLAFTASRDGFSPPPPVVDRVLAGLPLAERYVTGACRGGDAYIGAWLRDHRPNARHVVVIPADRSQVDPWWLRPGSLLGAPVVHVEKMPPGTSYLDRNARLVELADWITGFPAYPQEDRRSLRSGTWQTIRLAGKAGNLSQWHCVTPPYSGKIEAMPQPHPYCTVHDQPQEWCEEGYGTTSGPCPAKAKGEEKIRMLFEGPGAWPPVRRPPEAPARHQPWCGDVSLSRPVDECTCDITPQMQHAQSEASLQAHDQYEITYLPRRRPDSAAASEPKPEQRARHQPRRGDDVEAWLKRWRDEFYGKGPFDTGSVLDDMLDDYRAHADSGTPLDADD